MKQNLIEQIQIEPINKDLSDFSNNNTLHYKVQKEQEKSAINFDLLIFDYLTWDLRELREKRAHNLYVNFLKKHNFPEKYLDLKYAIVHTPLHEWLNMRKGKTIRMNAQYDEFNFYTGFDKSDVQYTYKSTTVKDLQDKAPENAEKIVRCIADYYGRGNEVKVEGYEDIIKEIYATDIIQEPRGSSSHPDWLLRFHIQLIDGQILDNFEMLIEVKSVQCTCTNKNMETRQLDTIKFNNASNNVNAIIDDLNVFHDKEVFTINSLENNDKTINYSTICLFFYYYTNTIHQNVIFFNFSEVWMPCSYNFYFDENGYIAKRNGHEITVKSAGVNSQNNNGELSLNCLQHIYEYQDWIFDRLPLFLGEPTSRGLDHLLTEAEVNFNLLYKMCLSYERTVYKKLTLENFYEINDMDSIMFPKIKKLMSVADKVKDDRVPYVMRVCSHAELLHDILRYKPVQVDRYNEFLEKVEIFQNNLNKKSYIDLYEMFRELKTDLNYLLKTDNFLYNDKISYYYNSLVNEELKAKLDVKKQVEECKSLEVDVTDIIDMQDNMNYYEFKSIIDGLLKRWNKVKKYDNVYDLTLIRSYVDNFKSYLKMKKECA